MCPKSGDVFYQSICGEVPEWARWQTWGHDTSLTPFAYAPSCLFTNFHPVDDTVN